MILSEFEFGIRDTMSSFGVGYATRSDEEGFGGIYGGNQYAGEQEKVGEDEDDDKKKTGSGWY